MDSEKESRTKKESNPKSKLFFHIEDYIVEDNDNESIREKESISVWKFVFYTLVSILIIVNVIFFGWLLFFLAVQGLPTTDLGASLAILVVSILAFPVALIDFIAVLFYVIKKKPQGTAKVISYTALTIFGLILVYGGIRVYGIYF
jgi:hypothetical protein